MVKTANEALSLELVREEPRENHSEIARLRPRLGLFQQICTTIFVLPSRKCLDVFDHGRDGTCDRLAS